MFLLESEYYLDSRLKNVPEYLTWVIIPRGKKKTLFTKRWHTFLGSYLLISVDCHFPLIIVCIVKEETDQPSFLLFSSFFLSLSLHTSPHTPLPSEFKAMENHCTEKWWEQSGSYTERLWSYPGYLISLYKNVWTVAWHFPWKMYSYTTSVWISPQKRPTELCKGHRVWASPHYELRSLRSHISGRHLGHRKEKKTQDIGKNPHKWQASLETD